MRLLSDHADEQGVWEREVDAACREERKLAAKREMLATAQATKAERERIVALAKDVGATYELGVDPWGRPKRLQFRFLIENRGQSADRSDSPRSSEEKGAS